MSNTPEFVAHALDLLESLGDVTARSMFGGHGLYARGVMFGLLDDEELFLRADDEVRVAFVEAACRQWSYPTKKGPVPGDYWRPPDAAHEDAEAMRPWAELGLAAALRRAAARAATEKPRRAKGAGAEVTASSARHRGAPDQAPPRARAKAAGRAGPKAAPAKARAGKRPAAGKPQAPRRPKAKARKGPAPKRPAARAARRR